MSVDEGLERFGPERKTGIIGKFWYILMLLLVTSIPPGIIFVLLRVFVFRESSTSLLFTGLLNALLMIYEVPFFWVGMVYVVKSKHVNFEGILGHIAEANSYFVSSNTNRCNCDWFWWW